MLFPTHRSLLIPRGRHIAKRCVKARREVAVLSRELLACRQQRDLASPAGVTLPTENVRENVSKTVLNNC